MIEDIRYLIVFAKIVQAGSISGGTEASGVSAATASQHLSRFEKNLGTGLALPEYAQALADRRRREIAGFEKWRF